MFSKCWNSLEVPRLYESVEILRLIEGVFDIYMPDIKYANDQVARKLSKAEDYPNIAKQAIKEMHRQVGDVIPCPRALRDKKPGVAHP